LKEILKETIVNWAASGGQIDALELAWDWGMHGDAELCMWAVTYGHLHVLQWSERMELLGTVMSSPVLRNVGTIML
jgi:hypothetical protein